ncbi:hypothetical protein EBS02_06450, partial [bacterium]|nr:hypothetical protein [bacterium]
MAETPVTGFDILNNTPPPLNMPTVSPLVSPETGMSQLAKRNIHPLVASVAPALYIAASATPLAPEEQNLVENWSKVKDIHDKLMSLPNNKAMEQFKLLQPDYQQALIQYYGVDYGTKPSNTDLIDSPEWQQQQTKQDQNKSLWGRTREIVASPFRAILHGAESYYQILMTPIHALENAAINNQSFWSKKNWDAAYNGKMLYDNNELDKLMNEYGQEVSYLATHVLAGQSVGDIVKQYGSKNKAMLDEVSKLMNHPEEYNFILEKFSQARLSPGRDMARWTLKSFGMKTSEHAGLFKSISGVIDAATSILADPLTYLTLGGSSMLKGASTSTKLAENLLRSESIDLHFADPKVAAFWTGYSEQIDLLKKARAEKDFKKAAEISDNISFNFAEHGTKAEQEVFLSAAKAQDIAAGKVVPFDAKQYFSDANNLNQLVRGLSSNTLHTREGAAFARTSRARTLGAKRKAVEFFVGEPNFAKLDKDGIDKFLDDAQQLGADRTGVLDYSEMDKFVEQHTEKGFKAFLRRQTSYAPGSGAVNVTDDGVAKTIETFRRQAFVALNDRVLADTIAQHFLECSQAERINIKRFIDETTLRRFGVHNMGTEGKRFMDEMLNAKYGSKDSFTAREKLEIPEHFKTANAGQTVESQGPLMSHQFQDEIRPLDWRRVKEFTAGKYRGSNLAEESNMEKASRIIGGAYSNKITNAITDIWSVLTLVPQLGIRTAID